MKKILFSLAILFSLIRADIVNNSNLRVLESLDIDDRFFMDEDLQEMYKDFTQDKRKYFIGILQQGYDILPVIRKYIYKTNVPSALLAVAMAESYFILDAKSHKKAKGLWQFMPKTAERFGLKIDDYVDERLDPVKSTEAALEYLSYLHNYFGKWYLAIMAYNAGEARIIEGLVRAKVDKLCEEKGDKCKKDKEIKEYRKIIKAYQTKGRKEFPKLYKLYKKLSDVDVSLEDLLKFQEGLDRQYIPKETRRYIRKILAMSFMINDNDFLKYSNYYILNSGIKPNYVPVKVPGGTSLVYVAKLLDIDYDELRSHNWHIKNSFTPPYKYHIYIPYEKIAYFKENFKPQKFFFVYRVKSGDNLYTIARRFHTKVKYIKDYNKLGKYLRVGQKIVIPLNKKIKFSKYMAYRVKKGDTLMSISKKFGVSYKEILKANNLKTSFLAIGQVIKIPKRR